MRALRTVTSNYRYSVTLTGGNADYSLYLDSADESVGISDPDTRISFGSGHRGYSHNLATGYVTSKYYDTMFGDSKPSFWTWSQ